jgi:arylsulfatase A-like enzyme/Tfp pilus assembly protein PilF
MGLSRSIYLTMAALVCSAGFARASTPVILISVDTLRADHLGCYQAGRRQTPYIDALAKSGTLFSQVSSPFPLTLPAHVALFTSTYPFANGVRDNGIPLQPAAVTLTTVLKSAGYRTAAFVGSSILGVRFGLSRGFDVYDGPLDPHNKTITGVSERKRSGAQVAEAATHWVERNSSTPFFLFLHFYDLHLPYDLPQDSSLRHGETGYAAELAYVDRVLGDFLAFLDRRQLLRKALIVFTSDHGEGLGEHGESSHGFFIYQSTLQVPLIIHWPAEHWRFPQDRVDQPAGLLDVAPTILDAIGVPRPSEMRGRSLMGVRVAEEIYSESTYARNHFGCASLRSLRVGDYKYIEAPKREFYDLSSDPNELRNLYDQQRARATALSVRLDSVRASAPAGRSGNPPSPTPETIGILRSLGYLGGSTSPSRIEPRVDPKDRIGLFERYLDALTLASGGKLVEADGLLENLRDKLPDVVEIRNSLGFNQQRLGDYARATLEFKRAIELDPANALAHFELGFCYLRLRQQSNAIKQLKAALALEPRYTRADEVLADIYFQDKDYTQARAHLNHLLSLDPSSYTAHLKLGTLAALEQKWSEAEQQMLSALRADPGSAEAHNTLGSFYLQRRDLDRARRQLEEAIRLQPKFASAHFNLGLVFQRQGRGEEAAQEFRAAQNGDR